MSKRNDVKFKAFKLALLNHYLKNPKLFSYDHLSTELWQNLFTWHFCAQPDSLEDPKWDKLLHEIGGMQADLELRKLIPWLVKKRDLKFKKQAA
ncbi:hypothetical protein KC851_02290 [Candidatus Kaiserbacteria bacterium]|nr:hypothetical protein [Candidatus Kaiserbacteria bacterium]